MQHFRRTGFLMKNRLSNIVKSYYGYTLLDYMPSKCASEMGFAPFSSAATGKAATNGFVKREGMKYGSKYVRDGNCVTKVKHEDVGLHLPLKELWSRSILVGSQSLFQPARTSGINSNMFFSARSLASKASESKDQNKSESRKDISTFEDPFDAPTDIIPEKPMTFTEGASYSLIILAGLGVAAAAAYAVLNELILQPKEYKIFGKALKRIQDDGQVRVRIGSPITGYGSESRNRAARQRIPNKIWTDQDNVEHVEVNFYIRGPNGAGKVFSEMFKDKVDGQWKFMFLIVEITSPSRQQLILESYIPA